MQRYLHHQFSIDFCLQITSLQHQKRADSYQFYGSDKCND